MTPEMARERVSGRLSSDVLIGLASREVRKSWICFIPSSTEPLNGQSEPDWQLST